MKNYYGWGLPVDISTHGSAIDNLIYLLHAFMAVLFVGWFVFFVYSLARFRASRSKTASHELPHSKLPSFLEVGVAVFELILLFVFAIPLFTHVQKNLGTQKGAMKIRVIAEQFAWNIHYPGPDGVFGRTDPQLMNANNPTGLDRSDPLALDDVTTINQLHIPVHTPISVELSSKDVIHSFAIPVMRVKQDVIPGQNISVGFEATQTGDFEIACAQLCGLGHYRMRGYFVVKESADFENWLKEQT